MQEASDSYVSGEHVIAPRESTTEFYKTVQKSSKQKNKYLF
jgi:hypothetical protein